MLPDPISVTTAVFWASGMMALGCVMGLAIVGGVWAIITS